MPNPKEPQSLAEQETREKMCEGKEPFPSMSAATAALKLYVKRRILRSNGLVPYKCNFCKQYHLGH